MFENVLKKGMIGSVELNNRFVMPAMGSSHAEIDGTVGDELVAYYAARARGGFGLLITEFTCIDLPGRAIPGQLMIYSDDYIPGLKRLTDAIHSEGSKCFLQLHHAGRETNSYFTQLPVVSASPVPCPVNRQIPLELTTRQVYEIIEKFGDAALRAKKAGYDGVELHGAHGYLIAQFMSAYVNRRTDEFGGDITGRSRFVTDVIKNIKQKCGGDFPVCVRISGDEMVESGMKINETRIMAKLMEKAGADVIHVSVGLYASQPYSVAPSILPIGFNLNAAEAVKKVLNIPVIAVGRINDPVLADSVVEDGLADFVALGRASLADPEFPKKVLEQRIDEISPCVGCMTRCQGTTPEGVKPGASCAINPFSGHELDMKLEKAAQPKSVVIVGAGVGGLETAWVSAARGHQVTLIEKDAQPGGQVIAASIPPHKQELARAVKYYMTMCKKYGVDVRLNTEADAEFVASLGPDVVVLGTGATPLSLQVPNDGIAVVHAIDILNGKTMAGNRVLIIGGGLVGLETADYMISQKKSAAVVEMLETTGEGLHDSTKFFLYKALREGGVDIMTSTKVERFTNDGAVCATPKGEIMLSGYDMIVLAVGAEAYNPLDAEITGRVPEVRVIGDAKEPRRILDAVQEGAALAISI